MWVKINIIEVNEKVICFPKAVGETIKDNVEVNFGKRKTRAKVKRNTNENNTVNSYENPYNIQVSRNLIDELLLQVSIVYQMKIRKDFIEIGPVIGLLLGNHCYNYSPSYMEKYSYRLKIHNKIGGLVCAFSPKTINFKKSSAYGLYYDVQKSKWKYAELPLPKVIYRRGFHTDERIIRKLSAVTQGKVFNSTRFNKYEFYEYINRNEELKKYQPPTELVKKFENVLEFINKHKNVILKPVNLSRGRGICLIEKQGAFYKIIDYRSKHSIEFELENEEKLKSFFVQNESFFKNYLIQKKISLCKINKSVFDIRVVMQKIKKDTWQCSGIECRISKEDSLITNISKGGSPSDIEEALQFKYPDLVTRRLVISSIKILCFKLCAYLDALTTIRKIIPLSSIDSDNYLDNETSVGTKSSSEVVKNSITAGNALNEHFAELGIDIALDEDNKLWIIEANVLPGFDGFKTLNRRVYSDIKYTPLLYAASLEKFGEENSIG